MGCSYQKPHPLLSSVGDEDSEEMPREFFAAEREMENRDDTVL